MTTTNDDILHIMAGCEPDYVKELRTELKQTNDQLRDLKLLLSEWYDVLELAREHLKLERVKKDAVDSAYSNTARDHTALNGMNTYMLDRAVRRINHDDL